jgi:hypothetical protein
MSALSLVERYFRDNGAKGDFGECEGCIFRHAPGSIHDFTGATEPFTPDPICLVVRGDMDAYECPAIDELIREENQRNEDESKVDRAMERERER